MIESRPPPSYRAYVLRFWETRRPVLNGPAVWRFSLEDPHTGNRHGFADLEGLVAFLRTQMLEEKNHEPGEEA